MGEPENARYRTTSWKSYNDGLRRRGSLLILLDKDMVWLAQNAKRPGRPPLFSDPTIQFWLSVKVLFGLLLREVRAMEAPLVRVTMARLHGGQHSGDGRAGLACAGPLHLGSKAENRCRPNTPPTRAGPSEPADRQ